jgi:hypothetical protein
MNERSPGDQKYLEKGATTLLEDCRSVSPKQDRSKTETRPVVAQNNILSPKDHQNSNFMAQNLPRTPETHMGRLSVNLDHSELVSQVGDLQNSCCYVTVPYNSTVLVSKFPHTHYYCYSCIVIVVFIDYSVYSDWLVSPTKV